MGQRLNIEIKENENVLANAYYHWSGYTSSSIEMTQTIINSIEKINHEDKIVKAIKLLEATDAGLTDDERMYVKNRISDYDKQNFIAYTGRNDGLIAVSEQGIESTRMWEEARVEIDIANKTVNFKAMWTMTKEEFEEDYENKNFNDIPIYDFTFNSIKFEKFAEFKDLILGLIKKEIYDIRVNNDEKVYSFIE